MDRSIEIIIRLYMLQFISCKDWGGDRTKSMLVINQIQTGLRLYCAWIGETIVPGCIGSDRQLRFEMVNLWFEIVLTSPI